MVFIVVVIALLSDMVSYRQYKISCTDEPAFFSYSEYYELTLSVSWNVQQGLVELLSHSKPVLADYSMVPMRYECVYSTLIQYSGIMCV